MAASLAMRHLWSFDGHLLCVIRWSFASRHSVVICFASINGHLLRIIGLKKMTINDYE